MRNKKGQEFMIGFFILSIVVITMGVIVLQNVYSTATVLDTTIENTSQDILIESGKSASLTLFPQTWNSATAKNRTWLQFDGANDYVTDGTETLNFPEGNFTISVWIKPAERLPYCF